MNFRHPTPEAEAIPAGRQFAAIAWLRWRLFANGFRRKGGTGEVVARIIAFPFAALLVIGPVAGAGLGAYAAASKGELSYFVAIFWGIFVLQILASINISPPALSFDPESLIRYPLSFPRYLTVRLFLGLLSVSTVLGTCALMAAATGIAAARRDLGPIAFAAALALALCNMLFIRTIFAWVDRWLSTRRARELFTVLIFAVSIAIQYINVTVHTFTSSSHAVRSAKVANWMRQYHSIEPSLHLLPPGLATAAIVRSNEDEPLQALSQLAGVVLFGAVCLAIFGWRMQREYRGENLSEAANSPAPAPAATLRPQRVATSTSRIPLLSPIVAACLEKEWIYVRRNPAQLFGLIAPLAMVFILAGRFGVFSRTGMVFPAAAAYSVLGIAALAYNVLGLDANGIQFYFLAPIPLRSVILAKNLFGFCTTALQVILVYLVLYFTSGPPPILITIGTVCWVVFACLVNATIGNIRSITAPRKIDPNRISRKQASQLSALMCIAIMFVVGALGVGLMGVSRAVRLDWLPIPILLALAVGAFALYIAGLHRVDRIALDHRESLIEELSRAS